MKERRFRLITANFVIVTVIALTAGIALAASMPAGGEVADTSAIYSGNADSGSVSLMFNVYQNTEQVLQIADIFKTYGFRTTFFVGGSWVARNGDALIKLAAAGFEIGNHGYLHRDHAKLDYRANRDEIVMTERIIETYLKGIACESPDGETAMYTSNKLFAPPSGSMGKNMFKVCEDLGMKVIMWTRDTIDWRDQDAELIASRALKDIRAGDLILMHPTPKSVEALPKILDYIKQVGLKADTVSRVIATGN